VSQGSPVASRCDSILALHAKLGRDVAGRLAGGLSRQEIVERAQREGLNLPDEVIELFAWRNGCQPGHDLKSLWLLPGYHLLTLEQALGQRAAVSEGWLPLLSNGGLGAYVVQCRGPGWGRILHVYPGSSDHGMSAFPELDALLAAIEEALASRAFVLKKGDLAPDYGRWLPLAVKHSGELSFWQRRLESLHGTIFMPTRDSTPAVDVEMPRLVHLDEWVPLQARRSEGTWRRAQQRQVKAWQFGTPFEPPRPEPGLRANVGWSVDPEGAAEFDGGRIRFRRPGRYRIRATGDLTANAESHTALVSVISPSTQPELVDAVADATRAAVTALFRERSQDRFYYCSLITTAAGLAPFLSAWSWEALEAAVRARPDDPDARRWLKWSYADSPFCCYGERHFEPVQRLYDALGEPDDRAPDEASHAFDDFRMEASVLAMQRLDKEGLFGRGSKRAGIVIGVEWMPPGDADVERIRRLNPPEALVDWLKEEKLL
jgi:hypothetical protein